MTVLPQTESLRDARRAVSTVAAWPGPAYGPPLILLGHGPTREQAILERLGQRDLVVIDPALESRPADAPNDARLRFAHGTDLLVDSLRGAFGDDSAFTLQGALFMPGRPDVESALNDPDTPWSAFMTTARSMLVDELRTLDAGTTAWIGARRRPIARPWRLFGISDVSTTALRYIMGDLLRAADAAGHPSVHHQEDHARDPFRAVRRLRSLLESDPTVLLSLVQSGAQALGPLAEGLPTIAYYSSDPERYPLDADAFTSDDVVFVADAAWTESFARIGVDAHVLPLASGLTTLDPEALRDDERWRCDALLIGNLTDSRDVIANLSPDVHQSLRDLAARLAQTPLHEHGTAPTSDSLIAGSPLAAHENAARILARAIEVEATWILRRQAAIDLADAGVDVRIHGSERWTAALEGTAAAACYRGHLDYRTQMPAACAGARVVVNVSSLNAPSALNMRAFDVPAVGGCLLTDTRAAIDEAFMPEAEIVTYDDHRDIPRLVRALIDDRERRDAIAAAGRARIVRDHTWGARWRAIECVLSKVLAQVVLIVVLGLSTHARADDDPRLTAPCAVGEVAASIDRYLAAAESRGFSGVVLVAQCGEVVLHRACGLAERGAERRNTVGTRFDIGSISKQITAAAVLRLAADGALDPTDAMGLHVGGIVRSVGRDKAPITIHHLLTHTSGLSMDVNLRGVDMHDRSAVFGRILAAPLESGPGTTYKYNNLGYGLLSAIVDAAGERSFEDFAREELFRRAELTATGFCGDADIAAGDCAHGFDGRFESGPAVNAFYGWGHRGATGVLTTAADLYRWYRALRSGLVLPDELVTFMFTPNLAHYACGWTVMERGNRLLINHGGSTAGGFYAMLIHEIDRTTGDDWIMIVLANGFEMFPMVTQNIPRLLRGEEVPLPPAAIAIEPAELDALAGTWTLADSEARIVLRAEDDHLHADVIGQDAVDLLSPAAVGQRRNLDAINDSIDTIVTDLFDAKYESFRKVIAPGIPKDWPDRLAPHLEGLLADSGGYARHEVAGSTASGPMGMTITCVHLHAVNGTIVPLAFHWTNGMIGSIDFARKSPVSARFEPMAEGAFASFDPASNEVSRLEVDGDMLKCDGRVLRALRPMGDSPKQRLTPVMSAFSRPHPTSSDGT